MSVAASPVATGGVALAGVLGVLGLAGALVAGSHGLVALPVGALALAAVGVNRTSYAGVPAESAVLVAIALLAWWSMDEGLPSAGEPGVDRGRAATSAVLALAAAGLGTLVVAMSSVASASLVGPAVGAAGAVSIAATLWSIARLRRYEAERRG